ncbi:MAG: hypothetical protein MH825_13040 [Cyanobacteria bacterium]|nr:hypothetical protein [Cyanobacteriota bacterium]
MNLHPATPIIVTLTKMESMRMAIALTAGLWPREGHPHDAVKYAIEHQGSQTNHKGIVRAIVWVTSLVVHDLSPVSHSENTDWDGGAPE